MRKLNGFLAKIYPVVQRQLDQAQKITSLDKIKQLANERQVPVIDAISRIKARSTPIGVIAEIKRSSPSGGQISERDVFAQVKTYIDNNAVAISVLTQPSYFNGSIEDLRQLKEKFPKSCFLRKDFIISEYQIYQSKAIGADMLLLITKLLDDTELQHFYDLTRRQGLQALIEVEDEQDLQRAQTLGAEIIGINSRNLNDLSVDVNRVTELAKSLRGRSFILVGESGLDNQEIVKQWHAAGIDVVLAGSAFMKSNNPGELIQQFSLAS